MTDRFPQATSPLDGTSEKLRGRSVEMAGSIPDMLQDAIGRLLDAPSRGESE